LLMKPLVIYQLADETYKIVIADKINGYAYNLKFKANEWYQIDFVSDKNKNISTLSINGFVVKSGKYIELSKTGHLGKGYKKRYWNGEIGDFKIMSYDNNETKIIYELTMKGRKK